MEFDKWMDESSLTSDWGQDLQSCHSDGLFDDLKLEGCLKYDSLLHPEPQDVAEHLSDVPRDEDILGVEWMESSDLSPYLDILDSSEDNLLSMGVESFGYTSSVAETIFQAPTPVNGPPGLSARVLPHFHQCKSISQSRKNACELESPPSLPMAPEQAFYLEDKESDGQGNSRQQHNLLNVCGESAVGNITDETFKTVLNTESFLLDTDSRETLEALGGMGEIMGSPLSADDVDSMLSFSSPSSPSTSSHGSLIASSPELYKVITSSSVDVPSRFVPYSTFSNIKERKGHSRRKIAPECIEHLNKKERKKMQNKNAAIRYRMKKKEEAAGIKSEEQVLEELNEALKIKVDDLQREIKYMKNLMEDVCRAKGLL